MSAIQPRTVDHSRATVVRLTVPTDANLKGNVFGGVILSEIDRVAYITATRHAGMNCVTASFDRVDFLAPVHLGEVVSFVSYLTSVGQSSMEVRVEVRAEELNGGPPRLVGKAFVTMVAIGADGRPAPVPPLELRTEQERREYAEGEKRMGGRRATRSGKETTARATGREP